jgi:hypothetical protein
MMHCTMDDLLALQANEGSVWARRHLEACTTCQAERDALYQRVANLKALPVRRPARDRWPVVRATILAERRHRRERWGVWSLAAAAVAALLVFRPFTTTPVDAAELTRAKAQCATLEQALHRYDSDARVTSGRSAALAAVLEDSIAAIDGALWQVSTPGAAAERAALVRLWQERVDLMERLVSVRVARATYVGL